MLKVVKFIVSREKYIAKYLFHVKFCLPLWHKQNG